MFFILTKKLTIEDKDLVDSFLKKEKSENSELTFTNLFMWRNSYNVEFAVVFDMLVIMSKHLDAPSIVYLPIGDGDFKSALEMVIKHYKEKGEVFKLRISSEADIEKLENSFPGFFEIKEDVDSNDYVYNADDLENLKGKKYHAKRNFINRFKNNYDYVYETMNPEMKSECLKLFDKWYDEKKDEVAGVDEQKEAVSELLENWEKLDIKGGCLKVDEKMIAFSFGEELISDNEMAVIHLEHADVSYDGAFPMMNNSFVKNEWSSYKYINREEDMGLEGLRKAKQSYYPVKMARKYIARFK